MKQKIESNRKKNQNDQNENGESDIHPKLLKFYNKNTTNKKRQEDNKRNKGTGQNQRKKRTNNDKVENDSITQTVNDFGSLQL